MQRSEWVVLQSIAKLWHVIQPPPQDLHLLGVFSQAHKDSFIHYEVFITMKGLTLETYILVVCSRSLDYWMTIDISGNHQRWRGHYTKPSKCARRKGIIGINKEKDSLAGSTYCKRITRNFDISWWESRVEHLCSTSKTTKWQKRQNSLACSLKTP